MAKAQPKKKSSPLMKWLAIGAVVVIGYLLLTPPDNSPAATASKPAVKKVATGDQAFLQVDYDRQANPYPPLKSGLIDAFKPDVTHGVATSESTDVGGPGWTYSGMATVNGVGEGIMVNTTTGESEILHRGETWEAFKVRDISADSMVFEGPNGPQTVHVDTKEADKASPTVASSAAVGPLPMPMGPMALPMTGDIGSGDQSLSIVQDNPGYGRGRGNRRRGRNAGN